MKRGWRWWRLPHSSASKVGSAGSASRVLAEFAFSSAVRDKKDERRENKRSKERAEAWRGSKRDKRLRGSPDSGPVNRKKSKIWESAFMKQDSM